MTNRKVAVLASGGFDSNVLIASLLKKYKEVWPIYIRASFVWEKAELFWLRRFLKSIKGGRLKPLTVLDLPVRDVFKKGWEVSGRRVPGYHSRDEEVFLLGRNLLLLSKSAVFCASRKIPVIAIGSLSGNPFPDATEDFFRSFGKTASRALGFRIRVIAPFLKLKKRDVLKKGKGLPLQFSFSCLAPKGIKPCRRCNKCAETTKVIY